MNEQMQFLANLIRTVKRRGDTSPGAVKLLRAICRSAADAAPNTDLIRMAQFLYDLRKEAEIGDRNGSHD